MLAGNLWHLKIIRIGSDMNFKALRAFSLVMEFGSVTAAADKLRLSTPAVSRLIGQLESETKLKLFNRTHRGLSPTEAGHLFIKEAQRILTDLDELPDVIRKIKRHTFQRLSILTTPRLVPGLIVPALARLSQRDPNVRCSLDVQPKWELERSLTRNRYDICAAILPVPNNTLSVSPLYRIASEVLMPTSHRLASRDLVNSSGSAARTDDRLLARPVLTTPGFGSVSQCRRRNGILHGDFQFDGGSGSHEVKLWLVGRRSVALCGNQHGGIEDRSLSSTNLDDRRTTHVEGGRSKRAGSFVH